MAEEKFDSIRNCWHGNGPECAKCEALDIPEVEELEQMYEQKIAAAREREAGLMAHIDQQQWALSKARPILEAIDNDGEYIPPRGFNDALNAVTLVSEMSPSAALEALRRREREAALRDAARCLVEWSERLDRAPKAAMDTASVFLSEMADEARDGK